MGSLSGRLGKFRGRENEKKIRKGGGAVIRGLCAYWDDYGNRNVVLQRTVLHSLISAPTAIVFLQFLNGIRSYT